MRINRGRSLISRFTANFRGLDDFILMARVIGIALLSRLALLVMTPTGVAVWLDKTKLSPRLFDPQKAVKFTDYVIRFRHRTSGGCLLRSLVLFRLFCRAGLPVQINFGLKRDIRPATELKGHSWVCLDGAPVMEAGDPNKKYAVMYSYTAGAGAASSAGRLESAS